MLLQLVQDPANLEYFIESDTILGALSRVLSDDRKKSTELVTPHLSLSISLYLSLSISLLRARMHVRAL